MRVFLNNFKGTLEFGLLSGVTTDSLNFLNGVSLSDKMAAGDWGIFTLSKSPQNPEVIKVTWTGSVFHLVRGLEGTVAQDWSENTILSMRVTAGTLEEFYNAIDTILVDQDGDVLTDGTNVLTL